VISDIRLAITFKGHRKRKRLQRTLGPGATDYLLDLWITIATDRPEGVLTGWDEVDIADAAGWAGEPEQLVAALVDCGWLEKQNGHYQAHDWEEHQGWVSGAKERSERARHAAKAKWRQQAQRPACGPQRPGIAGRMPPAVRGQEKAAAPLPSPLPSPPPETTIRTSGDVREADEGVYITKRKKRLKGKRLRDFERFWDAFGYKRDKAAAADAWLAVPGLSEELVARIVAAAESTARQRPELVARGRTPQYAEGWLSGRRWEDEQGEDSESNLDEALRRAGIE
jgi:hypothetical protein